MCRNTANNINFHYRTNPVKINDKIFQYIQQTLFLPIFPILGAKKFFLDNPGLSCATSYRFLASCQNLEKNNDTIPRQRSDRQKERRKDGQTLFYRTLPANARGPKILCYLQEQKYLVEIWNCNSRYQRLVNDEQQVTWVELKIFTRFALKLVFIVSGRSIPWDKPPTSKRTGVHNLRVIFKCCL